MVTSVETNKRIASIRIIKRKDYILFPSDRVLDGLNSKVGHVRVSVNSITKTGKVQATFLVKTQESSGIAEFDFADIKKAIEVYRMMPATKLYTSHLRSHLGAPMTVVGDQKRGMHGHIEVVLNIAQKHDENVRQFLIWKSDTNTKFSVENEAQEVAKSHALPGVYVTEVVLVDGVSREVIGKYDCSH